MSNTTKRALIALTIPEVEILLEYYSIKRTLQDEELTNLKEENKQLKEELDTERTQNSYLRAELKQSTQSYSNLELAYKNLETLTHRKHDD